MGSRIVSRAVLDHLSSSRDAPLLCAVHAAVAVCPVPSVNTLFTVLMSSADVKCAFTVPHPHHATITTTVSHTTFSPAPLTTNITSLISPVAPRICTQHVRHCGITGSDGLSAIRATCALLEPLKPNVNKTTGLHVHVGVTECDTAVLHRCHKVCGAPTHHLDPQILFCPQHC